MDGLARLYLGLGEGTRSRFANPFKAGRPNSFLSWAVTPQPEEGNLSPLLLLAHRCRDDVAAAFPDVRGASRARYVEWLQTDGVREMGYDPELLRLANTTAHLVGENLASSAVANEPHSEALDRPSDGSQGECKENGVSSLLRMIVVGQLRSSKQK